MLISIFIALIVAIFAWLIVKSVVLVKIVGYTTKENWGKVWILLKQYLMSRADNKIFICYLTSMAAIAGGLPALLSLKFEYFDKESHWSISGLIESDLSWVEFGLGLLMTIALFFYLYHRDKIKLPKWKLNLIEAAKFVNNELAFIPNREWFEKQNDKAIKELGTKYSRKINYPLADMPYIYACTDNDKNLIYGLFQEDFSKLVKTYSSYEYRCAKDFASNVDPNDLKRKISELISLMDDISSDNITNAANIVKSIHDDIRFLRYKDESKGHTYTLNEFQKTVQTFHIDICKNWVKWIGKKVLLIMGEAGVGKSHLLGELVTERRNNGLPSLLFLGQHFSGSQEPLDQMRTHLDIKCKNATFLENLNKYGESIDHQVLIVVDALNENAGIDYWKDYLTSVIADIEKFGHLTLVLSLRSTKSNHWKNILDLIPGCAQYNHEGFASEGQHAVEYIFHSFGLAAPSWPTYGNEFTNPLFLTKYCYSHQKSGKPLEPESFWTTINNYCKFINDKLSEKCKYDKNLNIVFDCLYKIAETMVNDDCIWTLDYDKAQNVVRQAAKNTIQPQDFLSELINEGLLITEDYSGKPVVTYEFDKTSNYFISYYLLNSGKLPDWLKQRHLIDYYWESLAILAPTVTGREIYELVPDNLKHKAISEFLRHLSLRQKLTPKALEGVSKFVDSDVNKALIICSRCLLKAQFPFNGDMLTNKLLNLPLTQRDALWTLKISEGYGEILEALTQLSNWGQGVSEEFLNALNDDTIRLCAEGLIWAFASTDQVLRDKCAHALVNILMNRPNILCLFLRQFTYVNDLYIVERLYLSAYGIVMNCNENHIIKLIAETVFEMIFNREVIIEDMLVRDSAMGIIEFAYARGIRLDIEKNKVLPPFGKGVIPAIKSSESIDATYKKDPLKAKDDEEKKIFQAQNWILHSMNVEYNSRQAMYGDFGRYVFQSSLKAFPEDMEEMSNWAIQIIFEEFRYDPKVFADFDVNHMGYRTGTGHIERIGKKYQKMAMNKIAAILADKHPDIKGEYTFDSPRLRIRSIDPSLNTLYDKTHRQHSIYEVPKYNLWQIKDNTIWRKSYKSMPSIKLYLETKDEEGNLWLNLFSYNSISSSPKISLNSKFSRELWVFVQGFIVDKKDLNKVCKEIYKQGLEGRRFHENSSINHIYNHEYYWSDLYKDFVDSRGYSKIPFSIRKYSNPDIVIDPVYLQYSQESGEDYSDYDDSYSMYMPNKVLVDGMGLRFTNKDGQLVNKEGELVCIDNYICSGGHAALLIRKDKLLEYLNKENKRIFWPILIERMLKADGGIGSIYTQAGGYAYMDKYGNIHYKFRSYEETNWDRLKRRVSSKIDNTEGNIKAFLVKHHIIKPKEDEMLNIIIKEAMTNPEFASLLESTKNDTNEDSNEKE